MEILFLVLIGLAAGFVKGASGFGSSLVAIPLLFLAGYSGAEAVTMMITTNIVLNVLLIYENRDYFHLETVKKIYPIIVAGVLFTGLGLYFNGNIDKYIIEVLAGILIVVAIINKITKFDLKIKDNFISLFIVGLFSGIGNGLASIDGPPVVFYLLGTNAQKERFKSTLAVHFFIMGIIGVIILYFTGSYTTNILVSTAYLFLGLVVGLVSGMVVGRRLDEVKFQKFVLIILIGLAVSLFIP